MGLSYSTASPREQDSALIKKLQIENEDLKIKQAVADEKDKHWEAHQAVVNELKAKCADKEKQLDEKDKLLIDNAHLIELLQAKDIENEEQLQSKSSEINQLQAKCDEKDAQLVDKAGLINLLEAKCVEKDACLAENDERLTVNSNLIEKLKAESAENKEKLQSRSSEVDKLQEACNNKDSKLDEKTKLVDKLQADCAEKDTQMKAIFDQLQSFGMNMYDNSKLVDKLHDCGYECCNQKQYTEALAYCQNAIELEKATQSRSSKLANLFSNKACYLLRLKQYQQCIDAADLALQYDPNHKDAFYNRACAYNNLKQYSNARQDLEKALQLDPTDVVVRKNLKRVQELINLSSLQ